MVPSPPPHSPAPASPGPVALVTGGAVRVGRALALGLAGAGYDLVVNYRTSSTAARSLAEEVERGGRRCVLAPGDVGDSADVGRMAEVVRSEYGRLDLLVNNASIFGKGALLELSESEWDRVMAVNLKGPFLTVQALAPLLAQSEGNVINISDLSAFEPWTAYPHHSVSKAGLVHLTRVMARAMAPAVRVNAIVPGTVLPPEDFDDEERARERDRTLVGELGTPEDVVRAALFLAESPFVNGEVLVVDGGARWRR